MVNIIWYDAGWLARLPLSINYTTNNIFGNPTDPASPWSTHTHTFCTGLVRAWYKSLARKGSFTATLSPKRLYASAVHFVAILGQRLQMASNTPDKHKQAMRNIMIWNARSQTYIQFGYTKYHTHERHAHIEYQQPSRHTSTSSLLLIDTPNSHFKPDRRGVARVLLFLDRGDQQPGNEGQSAAPHRRVWLRSVISAVGSSRCERRAFPLGSGASVRPRALLSRHSGQSA